MHHMFDMSFQVVSPTNLKHESNGITRGRSARGQEGLVGANQDDIIPIPASEVVKANSDKEKYLVCFFDQKRTWWAAKRTFMTFKSFIHSALDIIN